MKTQIKPTKRIALEVAKSINGALCRGAGSGEGQKVCVMQAIARAVDYQVEECVGSAVGAFNRRLNDCWWSSDEVRAKGMLKLLVASVGSNQLDQMAFGKLMFLRGTQKILPFVFREIAKIKEGNYKPYLEKHADLCENATTFEEARKTCSYASADADADADASAYADVVASADASAYADFKKAKLGENDRLLSLTAQVGLDCLKEMKSPGCKWLRFVK